MWWWLPPSHPTKTPWTIVVGGSKGAAVRTAINLPQERSPISTPKPTPYFQWLYHRPNTEGKIHQSSPCLQLSVHFHAYTGPSSPNTDTQKSLPCSISYLGLFQQNRDSKRIQRTVTLFLPWLYEQRSQKALVHPKLYGARVSARAVLAPTKNQEKFAAFGPFRFCGSSDKRGSNIRINT